MEIVHIEPWLSKEDNTVTVVIKYIKEGITYIAMVQPEHAEDKFATKSMVTEVRLYALSDADSNYHIKDFIREDLYSAYLGNNYSDWIDWGKRIFDIFVED